MSETSPTPYDLAIIGGGPGGYVTALRAAAVGQRVALIEQHEPGGVCLHTGCIPTKTMAAGVGLLRRAQERQPQPSPGSSPTQENSYNNYIYQ